MINLITGWWTGINDNKTYCTIKPDFCQISKSEPLTTTIHILVAVAGVAVLALTWAKCMPRMAAILAGILGTVCAIVMSLFLILIAMVIMMAAALVRVGAMVTVVTVKVVIAIRGHLTRSHINIWGAMITGRGHLTGHISARCHTAGHIMGTVKGHGWGWCWIKPPDVRKISEENFHVLQPHLLHCAVKRNYFLIMYQ